MPLKYLAKVALKGGIVEDSDLKKALLKKALGFVSDEIVEEYTLDEEGNSVLNKRKVTKKYNPPDLSAMKVLLDKAMKVLLDKADISDELSHMTNSQLKQEKKRLLKLLKEENFSES